VVAVSLLGILLIVSAAVAAVVLAAAWIYASVKATSRDT
jgi:hypothetical protein